MRDVIIQTNFTSGEISPRLKGRVDFDKYFNTGETLKNVIVQTHGGVFRRTGTRFVAEVETSSEKTRLIRFEFSITQAYIIELGNLYMRVYKDQGQILDSGSAYEVATPYITADLFEIQFVQSADVLYLAHSNYKPRKITRSGHTAWTVTNYAPTADPFGADGSNDCPAAVSFFEERIWWAGTNNYPQKLWASKTGDYENFTKAPIADDMSLEYLIAAADVSAIRYLIAGKVLVIGTTAGEYIIRASTLNEPVTPTNVRITLETTYGTEKVKPLGINNSVLFVQREGHKLREFIYIFENDSFIGKDLSIISEHLTATSKITQIAYQKVRNSIIWAVTDTGQLLSMTYSPSDEIIAWTQHPVGGYFGNTTVTVTDYVNIAVGTTISLTKSDGVTVVFTSEAISGSAPSETNGWRPNESNDTTADNIYTAINAHADFTVANPAAAIVTILDNTTGLGVLFQVATSDSTRLAVTNRAQAVVESVTVIPGSEGQDEVWICVKRTINGTTKRYIEFISQDYYPLNTQDKDDAVFVDSSLEYDGGSTTSITGLGHLEGESVTILANGAVQPNKTVASGAITLSSAATKAQIGLAYTSVVKTVDYEGGVQSGTSQTKLKRIAEIGIRFFESVGCKYGTSETSTDLALLRPTSSPMDSSPPLFTGDKVLRFPGGWNRHGQVVVTQDDPLPMNLLALILYSDTGDR